MCVYTFILDASHAERKLAVPVFPSWRPRRYLCGSPPVAYEPRRRARETAPGVGVNPRLDACSSHQRVCVPLDAAVTPCIGSCSLPCHRAVRYSESAACGCMYMCIHMYMYMYICIYILVVYTSPCLTQTRCSCPLSFFRATRLTLNPIAIPLHDFCAINARPPPPRLSFYAPYSFGDDNIV